MARTMALRTFSGWSKNNGVSVGPGHTQFTLMPWRAASRARDLVKAITPPLAPAYTVSPRLPTRPASLAMLTNRPAVASSAIIRVMKA